MKFEIDDQTKKDLDIFASHADTMSIFGLLNQTTCKGGESKLYQFLSSPMNDLEAIVERRDAISFFQSHLPSEIDVDKDALGFAEYYQKHREYSVRKPATRIWSLESKLMDKLRTGENYFVVEKGVKSTIEILKSFYTLCKEFETDSKCPALIKRNNEKIFQIFEAEELVEMFNLKDIKTYEVGHYNHHFRYAHQRNIQYIFDLIYEYDAFQSVAKVAKEYGLSYAEMLPKSANCLNIEDLFHPFISNAIANDVQFGAESNLLFVTGANMAGKSTFLKSLGVAVYLSHVGFPVPAKSMKMSLISGLCTTINISDSLSSGYSHFYAEVLRIKYVAERLKENNNMLVIFDELFRGTNVKDAYDGTLAIVSAFARIRSSFFVISTHIVEAAESLKEKKNISFRCFDIREVDGHPSYTYKLREGISTDRLGMYIIQKEKVVEIIQEAADKITE